MEYSTKVKSIGGSSYLLLPPKLVRAHKLKSGAGITLRESGDIVVMENRNRNIDKAGRELLEIMRRGLDIDCDFTREELYETDRY